MGLSLVRDPHYRNLDGHRGVCHACTVLTTDRCLSALVALTQSATHAQDRPRAFVGAKIIPIEGDEIAAGTLVIEKGKITAVGPVADVKIPDGAEKVDVTGKVIMPGLVCTHSHIGGMRTGSGGADGSGPIQPGVRIMDAISVHDAGFKRAVAGGLTTLNIMPGSGHLISGQTIYVKLRLENPKPRKIDNFFITASDGTPLGGLKMANGTNSMHEPPFPGSRGKSAFLVREQYIKAREYHDKVTRAAGDPAKLPPRDLHLETLVEAMQGKRIVHHHTHRHDDIMTVLRLANEFQFKVVLHHISDGWKVADEIAAAKVPCSVIVIDSPGGKLEAARFKVRDRRHPGKTRRARGVSYRRLHHRLAGLSPQCRAGRAGRHVAGRGAQGLDPGRRRNARLAGPGRLAEAGQGRRLCHPAGRPLERLLPDPADLGRGRKGLRSQHR